MFDSAKAFSGFSVNDIAAAKEFYGTTLGLTVRQEGEVLQLEVGAGNVFIYPKGDQHEPASFTVLNFPVPDVDAAVDELISRGITMQRYEGFPQDDKGIARDDNGPTIAWFTDPAGNVIAVLSE